MTGSAMRKPRIQPGNGSASADSMIDGRTIDTGTLPLTSVSACSPSAFVYAYASGQPTLAGAGAAGLDQLVLDPVLADALGLGGECGRARQRRAPCGPRCGSA